MDTYIRFLYEFLTQFFSGFLMILEGLFNGIKQLFNFSMYTEIVNQYKNDFSISEWILVALAVLAVVIVILLIVGLIYFFIRRHFKLRKAMIDQESMLEEIGDLNKKVVSLVKEKEEILAMKVSQLGLKPGESNTEEISEYGVNENGEVEEIPDDPDTRFPGLTDIDRRYAKYKVKNYGNTFDMPELCERFRQFAASRLGLYYKPKMIRLFISGLASTKLIILQGISGTGKTSLAYAWGKFMKHDSCVASVQPSWRDRTEIFGYFNEFTKKFNETEMLKAMYEAGYTDDVYTMILDEMNLARVEYYFAEMLSILEMHNTDEWIIQLVSSPWPTDPKRVIGGRLKVPANMWYIGTINNDDSTFMVTDKVYDRAMPIDINDKGEPFEFVDTPPLDCNFSYLSKVFEEAMKKYAITQESLDKIEKMDNYVIQHFRVAFGNRIVKHMRKFVPVYVAAGGTEVEAIDYFIAQKILRKFEQLNIALIRDEIDPYIKFLNETFGDGKMEECIDFLVRLKKMS